MSFPKLRMNDWEYSSGLAIVIMQYTIACIRIRLYTIVYACIHVSMIPKASNLELFLALVNDFQPLSNVTNNSISDAVGILDTSLTCRNITI